MWENREKESMGKKKREGKVHSKNAHATTAKANERQGQGVVGSIYTWVHVSRKLELGSEPNSDSGFPSNILTTGPNIHPRKYGMNLKMWN